MRESTDRRKEERRQEDSDLYAVFYHEDRRKVDNRESEGKNKKGTVTG